VSSIPKNKQKAAQFITDISPGMYHPGENDKMVNGLENTPTPPKPKTPQDDPSSGIYRPKV